MFKFLGNVIWVIFGGFEWFLALLVAAVAACCTIIGIPVGIQLFQLAVFVLWPFKKTVVKKDLGGFKKILNVIWAILFGWEIALLFLFMGAIFCITIIGIPFGKQYFKIAKFALFPLGHTFAKK